MKQLSHNHPMPNTEQRSLNAKQEVAASHLGGAMLVRAGAGTGKTTVLVERTCPLIADKHARPDEILAVTFTEEAAREMGERARKKIESKLGVGSAAGLRTATFHACCQEILTRNNVAFEVLDQNNLWVYLRRELDARRLPLKEFLHAANPAKFLHDFIDFFERCSDELVDASRYGEYVSGLRNGSQPPPRVSKQKEVDQLAREQLLSRCEEIAAVYSTVERLLHENNLGTFGLMIVRAVQLLRQRPELLKSQQERARFLLIDEFQDCNAAQIEFAQLLAGSEQNVFAVGDPDQAIYRFRGASSGAFDEFLRRFKGAKTVTLGENYRSTPTILRAAYALISSNVEMQAAPSDKAEPRTQLQSGRAALAELRRKKLPSPPVEIVINNNAHDEAYDIAGAIEVIRQNRGAEWQNFAVLYRSHLHRVELIKELGARGIPFVVVGVDLLNTGVLRDVVAALRAFDPVPDDVSLFRLVLMPRFGIDLMELQRQLSNAKRGTSLTAVLDSMPPGRKLLLGLKELQTLIAVDRSPTSAILAGVMKYFQIDAAREETKRFSEFVRKWEALSITATGHLPEFIEYLDYFLESGGCLKSEKVEKVNAVRLMTIHAAKGLEFDHVFVMRVCSPSFPSNYHPPLFEFPRELRAAGNVDGLDDNKEVHREEERRVFYVAMTRARETLALHGKASRGKERVPSAFLRELTANTQAAQALHQRDAAAFRASIAASTEPSSASSEQPPGWLLIASQKDWANQPLSHYAIERYETCPLQFKLARDWNLPAEPAAMMQFGAVMHRVLSDYYYSVMAGNPYSEKQTLGMFADGLEAAGMEDPLQRELYGKQGMNQLRRFLLESSGRPQPNVLGTEQTFKVEIGGVTVKGRIDRIDRVSGNAVEIVDYKTGASKKKEDADKSLQLSIYAIAAKRHWNYDVERLVFHNLEDNSRVETIHSAEKLAKAEEKVRSVAQAIREGKFDANPGRHCQWCGYRELCPATEEKLYTIATAAKVQ